MLLPDVVVCCCILHNLLLSQSAEEVDYLLAILQGEGMARAIDDNSIIECPLQGRPHQDQIGMNQKRADLAAFLMH